VALCLYCLWTSKIFSEIHRLSCRKAASRRPAQTAGPPRRLTTEGPLAVRRRVQEGRSPSFPEDTAMTDSLYGSSFQNLPDARRGRSSKSCADRNRFASSASHRLANPHRMNSGTIRRDAPLQCGYLLKEELAEVWEQRDGRAAPNPRVRAAFNPLRIDFVVRRLRGHLSSRRQSARSISAVACLPILLFTLFKHLAQTSSRRGLDASKRRLCSWSYEVYD
jgi:hypothetical protein